MPRYVIRVELHEEDADYDRLHQAMEEAGFAREIVSSRGGRYRLPRATYRRVSDETSQEVLARAKRAARTVWNDFGVIVTEGSSRWYNLREAEVADLLDEMDDL
jgi:hypothetical protein